MVKPPSERVQKEIMRRGNLAYGRDLLSLSLVCAECIRQAAMIPSSDVDDVWMNNSIDDPVTPWFSNKSGDSVMMLHCGGSYAMHYENF